MPATPRETFTKPETLHFFGPTGSGSFSGTLNHRSRALEVLNLLCLGAHERWSITQMHAGAPKRHFASQKCMPERPDTVSHYKNNACRSVRTPFRSIKMHAGASGRNFTLQKCMPERPDTASHYKNACRSVRTSFRITKMHAGAPGRRFTL